MYYSLLEVRQRPVGWAWLDGLETCLVGVRALLNGPESRLFGACTLLDWAVIRLIRVRTLFDSHMFLYVYSLVMPKMDSHLSFYIIDK